MARKKDKDDQPGQSNGDGPSEEAPQALLGTAEGGRAATQAQLTVLAQYIKDLSFENPGAPQSLQGPGQNPQLKVGVNVHAQAKADEAYEVSLNLEVHAKSDSGVIYNIELVLFVDCPAILFPFMRRVLADVVRDGGFPPLMLDPIDFGRLYAQNLAKGEPMGEARAKN
jgi:preprotein translocase subunit SecB